MLWYDMIILSIGKPPPWVQQRGGVCYKRKTIEICLCNGNLPDRQQQDLKCTNSFFKKLVFSATNFSTKFWTPPELKGQKVQCINIQIQEKTIQLLLGVQDLPNFRSLIIKTEHNIICWFRISVQIPSDEALSPTTPDPGTAVSPNRSNTRKMRVTQRLNSDFLPQRWCRWWTCHFLQPRCSVPPASSTLPLRFNTKWEKHPFSSAICAHCWGESLCLISSHKRQKSSTCWANHLRNIPNGTVTFHFNTVNVDSLLVYTVNSSV